MISRDENEDWALILVHALCTRLIIFDIIIRLAIALYFWQLTKYYKSTININKY